MPTDPRNHPIEVIMMLVYTGQTDMGKLEILLMAILFTGSI